MIKWFLDKSSKIPLYLQLKDLIKYYISTGAIKDSEQLPGVIALSEELEINFETVRKAYKELEKEGLIFTRRGRGTFVILRSTSLPGSRERLASEFQTEPDKELRHAIKRLFREGKKPEDVRILIDDVLKEASQEPTDFFVIFTECSEFQVKEISKALEERLRVKVKPVIVADLKREIDSLGDQEHKLLAVVTTGFHLNEVRKIIDHRPVDIQILITHMSPETRLRLSSFSTDTKFGFICRDVDSISVYTDMLKTELGGDIKISSCLIADKAMVDAILQTVDVLLVTPSAYEAIKSRTLGRLPVFNVFDSIDPMSLKIVQAHISQKIEAPFT
ncbi:MAG TPA: GntR family transcriptional regulator [Thermodesulfovibrionales bacterium]|nr:GntR family transcriptional regulator [Thermodesulfovibrionales bacterium]